MKSLLRSGAPTAALIAVACCLLILFGLLQGYSKPGISHLETTLTSPNNLTETISAIDPKNAASLQELQILSAGNDSRAIVALHLNARGDLVYAVYSGDAQLRSWKIGDSQLVKEFDLGEAITHAGVSFDDNDLYVLNSTQASTVNDGFGGLETRFAYIRLTSLLKGSLVKCYCLGESYKGLMLHPSGRWVLFYDSGGGLIKDIDDHDPKDSFFNLINPEDYFRISTVAFDPTGTILAVAFEEGFVRLYKFQNGTLNSSSQAELGIEDRANLIPVEKVLFDSGRNWLATLRGGIVSVWNLQESGHLYWQSSIPTATEIAFDRLGKLLFIGTDSALEVWDLESKSLLQSYPAPGVTTIVTTPDGRLVIWGDQQGVIHLWGVRAP